MSPVSRRALLQSGLLGAAAVSLGPGFWRAALAAEPARPVAAGPYGPLLAPDANGIRLPQGFTSRVVARANAPVAGYPFPIFPDGQATYATPDGGWILVTNSEVPGGQGGASAIRFGTDGTIADAYRILGGTSTNCAGGPTPWATWLSCEEVDDGLVFECDPTGARAAVARPALGTFKHEAVCVDPAGVLYLSEDLGDGGFYRFVPDAYPDLSAGRLEIATGEGDRIVWKRVPDPTAKTVPTRSQLRDTRRFARGEGIWFDAGLVYLATTEDETIHVYDTRTERIEVVYTAGKDTPLRGVDNLHVSRSGDLFVAEDSYDNDPDAMDVCIITPQREVSRFLKLTGREHFLPRHAQSETVGLAFDPSGTRLYFGSQRAAGFGAVYEVTGPFRGERPTAPTVKTALGLTVANAIALRRFRRTGVPVRLTLDTAAPVRLTLTAKLDGRQITLARLSKRVDRGPETLSLRPTTAGARALRGRRKGVGATLHARIGKRTLTRRVRLRV